MWIAGIDTDLAPIREGIHRRGAVVAEAVAENPGHHSAAAATSAPLR
jgi:hypothetical protein